MPNTVIYFWYDHLLLRKTGEAKTVQEAIRSHDYEAFKRIRDKYEPNPEGLCYFPATACVYDEGSEELVGEIDIMTPDGFAQITDSDYECG